MLKVSGVHTTQTQTTQNNNFHHLTHCAFRLTALFKAGMYPEATRAAAKVDSPQYSQRIYMLQASIKYESDELSASTSKLDACLPDDPETIIAYAAISYKEGKFEESKQKYSEALNTLGYQADLSYNIALCHYKLKQNDKALKMIGDVS